MKLENLDPLTDPRYRAYAEIIPGGLFLHPDWLQAIAATYGFSFEATAAIADGTVRAALPWAVIDDIRGPRVRSLPFCDYLPATEAITAHWSDLVAPVVELGLPYSISTPVDPGQDDRFDRTETSALQILTINGDIDEMMSAYKSTTRNRVKKAAKEGISYEARYDLAAVRDFYDMHLGVRKHKHHLLPQPFGLFEQLYKEFIESDRGAVILGLFEGEPICGTMVFEVGDTLYYKFSASRPEMRGAGSNQGLLHAVIEYAIKRGAATVDLGRGDLDQPGLLDFKRYFGAVALPILTLDLRGTPEPTSAHQAAGAMLGEITELLVQPDVPDSVTEEVGSRLYQYFC